MVLDITFATSNERIPIFSMCCWFLGVRFLEECFRLVVAWLPIFRIQGSATIAEFDGDLMRNFSVLEKGFC